ncbi:MAG: glycoside hydrolase family 2 TIM barrel-domain containing protein [Bacteroides cellulosilyticus]
MMLRYRNHPSIISWVGVNEVLMNENLYRLTKEKVKSLDTTRIYIPTTSYHWDVDALTPPI